MVRKRSGFRKKALNFAIVAVRDPWSGTQNFVVVPLQNVDTECLSLLWPIYHKKYRTDMVLFVALKLPASSYQCIASTSIKRSLEKDSVDKKETF